MDILVQVFAWIMMVGIISILVIVHESGHFLVARLFGFQTPVFGIGLPVGPYVVVGHKWGTQFRIHYALLGGYVAIPELGDESQFDGGPEDQNPYGVPLKPFNKFPIWQRALVAFAGVGFNILFAYLIMFMMLLIQGDPKIETQIQKFDKKLVIARDAGVKEGDMLKAIDDYKVGEPSDAVKYLGEHPGQQVTLHLVRAEKPVDIQLTTSPQGRVGMVLEPKQVGFQKIEKSPPEIAGMAAERLAKLTSGMVGALGQIGKGLYTYAVTLGKPPVTGEVSVGPGDVHGILAVMKLGADIAQEQNWNQLFIFTILISMDLAIVNLFPLPALDGGHLAFMLFEAIRGKPMGEKVQGELVRWGMISLLLLMVVIMFNDVTALFTGKLDSKKVQDERKLKEKRGAAGSEEKGVDGKSPGDADADGKSENAGSETTGNASEVSDDGKAGSSDSKSEAGENESEPSEGVTGGSLTPDTNSGSGKNEDAVKKPIAGAETQPSNPASSDVKTEDKGAQ